MAHRNYHNHHTDSRYINVDQSDYNNNNQGGYFSQPNGSIRRHQFVESAKFDLLQKGI